MSKPALGVRKPEILEAALDLFHRNGFHRVGMGEIGAAVGVSGPAIYSHFPSKTSLLVAIFDRTAEELFDFGPSPTEPEGPEDALRRLVAHHVDYVLNSRPLISIWVRDTGSLPPADQERVREIQRRYLRLWVDQLRALHTDMSPAEAHSIVQCAFNLMGSVAFYEPKLGRQALRRLLERKATALLLEP
ncbi:MAG TPA: TetR/AcrR family transcriptional regulator [Sporichthya sp.]|nr:TetR/AcrR family transcriptional regulator [Sporichthya sp.]